MLERLIIPLEIQMTIVSYLDILTVHRCRLVCKTWKSEIDLLIQKQQEIFHRQLAQIDCNIYPSVKDNYNQIKLFAFLQKKIDWTFRINYYLCRFLLDYDTRIRCIDKSIMWNTELLVIENDMPVLFDYSGHRKVIIKHPSSGISFNDFISEERIMRNYQIVMNEEQMYILLTNLQDEVMEIYFSAQKLEIVMQNTDQRCVIKK